jgi:23S rRNA (guanine2445-N2)-methyltransferase / 23S rRNA (guanine2069-N7)-methyltransferase
MNDSNKTDPPLHDQGSAMLVNRLRKNQRSIGKWARQQNLQCYRLYDADLPEYAFAIDCYGRFVHMQEYQPPASIDEAKVSLRREQARAAVQQALNISSDLIVMKTRQRQRGKQQYQALNEYRDKHRQDFVVLEGEARFLVNLHDYLDTGLFLDHRPMRRFIYENARNKRFLNLFCYTATASVHAALGGAASSLSIDLSNTYLDWARKNYGLNGIGGKQHRLKREDCMAYLESGATLFDLIFLDPPTFSNSKSTDNILDIQRDHVSLIKNAMKKLDKNGLLIFSANKRNFKLDDVVSASYELKDYTRASLDKDFQRSRKIHQTWLLRHG